MFQYLSASHLQNVYLHVALPCKINLCQKNDISGYIWHWSFIQIAKCSLLDEEIVYQSFYGAPLMLVIFYFEEKFCVLARIGETCVAITAKDLLEKIISPVIFGTNCSFKQ